MCLQHANSVYKWQTASTWGRQCLQTTDHNSHGASLLAGSFVLFPLRGPWHPCLVSPWGPEKYHVLFGVRAVRVVRCLAPNVPSEAQQLFHSGCGGRCGGRFLVTEADLAAPHLFATTLLQSVVFATRPLALLPPLLSASMAVQCVICRRFHAHFGCGVCGCGAGHSPDRPSSDRPPSRRLRSTKGHAVPSQAAGVETPSAPHTSLRRGHQHWLPQVQHIPI